MKRRQFLHGAQLGTVAAIAAIATGTRQPARSQSAPRAASLRLDYLGTPASGSPAAA